MIALDTSTLGPICSDPDGTATRARIVREALKEIAGSTQSPKAMQGALLLALADDATLSRLGRLLR